MAENRRSYSASVGIDVRFGRRQSMPSSSIDNCAGFSVIVPVAVTGQTKRPRPRRFENRQSPWPSNHSSLTRWLRLPRNANSAPECGFCANTCCTSTARPSNPRACRSRRTPEAPVSAMAPAYRNTDGTLASTSTCASTLPRTPSGRSMWMNPDEHGAGGAGSVTRTSANMATKAPRPPACLRATACATCRSSCSTHCAGR